MIRVGHVEVFNFEGAIRGLRNPMNSWDNSDSGYSIGEDEDTFVVGKNDIELMQKLYKAGTEHRKYLRQIFISMDVVAPLYWWKEADQYRIGVTTNSCSTMHAIHKKEFELDDFSHEHLIDNSLGVINCYDCIPKYVLIDVIDTLNRCRKYYLETKDKIYWWQMIQLLPSSYNQKRTITMNYENVVNILNQRTGHKLDEWNEFVSVLKGLPYVSEIMEG